MSTEAKTMTPDAKELKQFTAVHKMLADKDYRKNLVQSTGDSVKVSSEVIEVEFKKLAFGTKFKAYASELETLLSLMDGDYKVTTEYDAPIYEAGMRPRYPEGRLIATAVNSTDKAKVGCEHEQDPDANYIDPFENELNNQTSEYVDDLTPVTMKRLQDASVFVATDKLRPAMCGVYLENGKVVGTDAHTMYWGGIDVTTPTPVILRPEAIKLLTMLQQSDDWSLTYVREHFDNRPNDERPNYRLVFENEAYIVRVEGIDERYPAWEAVIPHDNPFKFTFQSKDFVAFIDKGLKVANKETNMARVTITDKDVTFLCEDEDYNRSFSKVLKTSESTYGDTEPYEFGMNIKMYKDKVNKVLQGEVSLNYQLSPNRAFVYSSEGTDAKVLQMPIMIEHKR